MADALRVHRLGAGLVVAWLLVAAGLLGAGNALLSGGPDAAARVSSACLAAALAAAAYPLGVRPAVSELPGGLEVRNPWRTAVVPWAAVTDVELRDVVVVEAGDVAVRCFALPRRGRADAGAAPAAAVTPGNPGLLPRASAGGRWRPAARRGEDLERLRDLARRLGPGHAAEPVAVRWAPDGVGATAACAVLVAVSLALR